MKRVASFLIAVLVSLIAVYAFIAFQIQFGLQFNWSTGVYFFLAPIGFVLFFEIPARLGPKKFETPISLVLKESMQDRITICSAAFVGLFLFSFFSSLSFTFLPGLHIPTSIYSIIWAITMYLVALLVWLILFFFGSEKLRNSIVSKRIKEAEMRDKVLILLGEPIKLIMYVLGFSFFLDRISQNLFIEGFVWLILLSLTPDLINFFFGSQKLRDETTPKWFKNLIAKRQETKGKQ